MPVSQHNWPVESRPSATITDRDMHLSLLDSRLSQFARLSPADTCEVPDTFGTFTLPLSQDCEVLASMLERLPLQMYIARLHNTGVNVWRKDDTIHAYFSERMLPVAGVMFEFDAPFDNTKRWRLLGNAIDLKNEPVPLYPSSIFGLMAARSILRLIHSAPNNVRWARSLKSS